MTFKISKGGTLLMEFIDPELLFDMERTDVLYTSQHQLYMHMLEHRSSFSDDLFNKYEQDLIQLEMKRVYFADMIRTQYVEPLVKTIPDDVNYQWKVLYRTHEIKISFDKDVEFSC